MNEEYVGRIVNRGILRGDKIEFASLFYQFIESRNSSQIFNLQVKCLSTFETNSPVNTIKQNIKYKKAKKAQQLKS